MAALKQRFSMNTAKLFGTALRRSASTQTASKSFVVPIIAGSLMAGTGFVSYSLIKNDVFKFLPAVHASAVSI